MLGLRGLMCSWGIRLVDWWRASTADDSRKKSRAWFSSTTRPILFWQVSLSRHLPHQSPLLLREAENFHLVELKATRILASYPPATASCISAPLHSLDWKRPCKKTMK